MRRDCDGDAVTGAEIFEAFATHWTRVCDGPDGCGRIFDLLDETDTAEWWGGHDCEVM